MFIIPLHSNCFQVYFFICCVLIVTANNPLLFFQNLSPFFLLFNLLVRLNPNPYPNPDPNPTQTNKKTLEHLLKKENNRFYKNNLLQKQNSTSQTKCN